MYRQVKDKVIQFSVKWTILLNITLIMYRQVKDKVIQFSVKWTILLNITLIMYRQVKENLYNSQLSDLSYLI